MKLAQRSSPPVTVTLPARGPLTIADLETMPDDGRRYELIHGTLVVTPSPVNVHQIAVLNLAAALKEARPRGFTVMVAPVDVRQEPDTVVQPDVLVVTVEQARQDRLSEPPLLAVEVLSASTRAIDLGAKRMVLAEMGVRDYWVVDPRQPSVLFLALEGDEYVVSGRAAGDEAYRAERPYPLTVVPSELVEP